MEKIPSTEQLIVNGKPVLREEDAFESTGYAFSPKKKWWILTVVALCQTSMNYNAAVYSNAVEPLNRHHGIENARHGMIAFLVTYAFGCELWAPWSEEIGRWPVMQLSLGLVNIWQILCGASHTWKQVLIGRVLGGLSSAGGSVTLGMVADMFDPDEQQFAVAWVSLWSCLGSVIGGICGGPIEQYLPWRWNFWIQLIFGAVVQAIHAFTVPETRSTIMLDREARKRRTKQSINIYGPNEVRSLKERFAWREILATMWRPYRMLLTEPIVLLLSLLSGFSDALIFSFLESYGYVFNQWHFNKTAFGLAMIPLLIGYVLAYLSFFPVILRHNFKRRNNRGHELTPESRLWLLLFIVPLLPVGLFGFAFVSTGPPIPWIAPLIFSVLIGMANYAIYYATIDYMVASYGEYAASATGGNGFMRDFLAGMCALYTGPLYKSLKPKNASFLLFGTAVIVCIPVYVFYWFGPRVRKHSKFAEALAADKEHRVAAKHEDDTKRREQLLVQGTREV
ncbi:MFS general substrate transporter [Lindgomyces ingoldianus]|uniref:MFS general substrate transporter n=1 Tax=Lindgomyces ingoldianus TaxID=673940 RepID=A0ACB6RCF7_9PLEO|nr:MFS general substrate transporter [Lindgomyces ingoldianus]KAF2476410.1 MFS general substrate transporter [Lindgomyces ingoldianus]